MEKWLDAGPWKLVLGKIGVCILMGRSLHIPNELARAINQREAAAKRPALFDVRFRLCRIIVCKVQAGVTTFSELASELRGTY